MARLDIILDLIDNASQGIAKFGGNLEAMSAKIGQDKYTFKFGYDKKESTSMLSNLKDVVTTFNHVVHAARLVTEGVGEMWDFINEGADYQRMKDTTASVVESYGSAWNEIYQAVKTASLGTISEEEAMYSSNIAMMLGVGRTSEEIGKLVTIAGMRGRAFGMTTAQAFETIARGIGRLSPWILDNIGLVIDAETTYSEYADSLGITTSELTKMEKRQALTNRVIQEGTEMFGDLNSVTLDTATIYERVSTNIKNYFNEMQAGASDTFMPLFASTEDFIKVKENEAEAVMKAGGSYEEYVSKIAPAMTRSIGWFNLLKKEIEYRRSLGPNAGWSAEQQRDFLVSIGAIQSEYEYELSRSAAMTELNNKKTEEQNALIKEAEEALREEQNAMLLQAGTQYDLTGAIEEYNAAMVEANKLSGDKKTAAIEEANISYADSFNNVTTSLLEMLEISSTVQLQIGATMGTLDQRSMAMFLALQEAKAQFEGTEIEAVAYMDIITRFNNTEADPMQILTDIENLYNLEPGTLTAQLDLDVNTEESAAKISGFLAEHANDKIDINVESPGLAGVVNEYNSIQDKTVTITFNSSSGINIGWGGKAGVEEEKKGLELQGGTVSSGKQYIVGEGGIEIFRPAYNGTIISNRELSRAENGKGKEVAITINYNPMFSTASRNEVEWSMKPIIRKILKELS